MRHWVIEHHIVDLKWFEKITNINTASKRAEKKYNKFEGAKMRCIRFNYVTER